MMTAGGDNVAKLLNCATINEGIWGNPLSFILSATHTDDDIDQTLEKYERALQNVRTEGAI